MLRYELMYKWISLTSFISLEITSKKFSNFAILNLTLQRIQSILKMKIHSDIKSDLPRILSLEEFIV
jgi:hypothetical protein